MWWLPLVIYVLLLLWGTIAWTFDGILKRTLLPPSTFKGWPSTWLRKIWSRLPEFDQFERSEAYLTLKFRVKLYSNCIFPTICSMMILYLVLFSLRNIIYCSRLINIIETNKIRKIGYLFLMIFIALFKISTEKNQAHWWYKYLRNQYQSSFTSIESLTTLLSDENCNMATSSLTGKLCCE